MAKQTLVERIDDALKNGPMSFADLASHLYKDPKSWRYQVNGGPPGCYMALSAGIRRGGFGDYSRGAGPSHRMIWPRSKSRLAAAPGLEPGIAGIKIRCLTSLAKRR